MSVTSACRLFDLPRSTYYAWRKKQKDGLEMSERKKQDIAIKNMMLALVQKKTHIPGKRIFRELLLKEFRIEVSVERISRLMKELNLEASTTRRKDAYKGLMLNIHPCCALKNYVNQDFFIGCRTIILTDITYIPYGLDDKTYAYLCTFIDPYTKEVLGWSVDSTMTVELVQNALDQVLQKHGDEFPKDSKVYIHSDQGCQYLSSGFREVAGDFAIQSMSRRGNSLDNAPQESFFGRMKSRIESHFPLMKNCDQVRKMIDSYIHEYNEQIPSMELGGLTPKLFYQYKMTGIYPKSEYFGIPADQLNDLDEVIRRMRAKTDAKSEKRRQRDKQKGWGKTGSDPKQIVEHDRMKMLAEIEKLDRKISREKDKRDKITGLLEKAETAREYLDQCSPEEYEAARSCTGWDLIPQLSYVKDYSNIMG